MAARIGVFVCDCAGQIAARLDLERLMAVAAGLDEVAFVARHRLLCAQAELGAAVRRVADEGCDRLLLVGCSPRSSLKFPEERLGRLMATVGLAPDLCDVANVREQCAWQHSDREAASRKAVDLLRMAHARLLLGEPRPAPVPIPKRALVVGGGAAGLQAAKDLAAAGIAVDLVERQSWLGGRICQLHRVFQTEAWPSLCDSCCIGPVQAKGAVLDEGITLLTQARVTSAAKVDGGLRVAIAGEPVMVDPDRCIGCGECARICPEETARQLDGGASKRKAIDKELERAVPDSYVIVPEACTRCGDCLPVCPTAAIDLAAEPRRLAQDYGAVLLATGFEPIDLGGEGPLAVGHPNVVTALELERIMNSGFRRPSDGKLLEQVVFVQCAGSRAGPERGGPGVPYCSKTCCSVTVKQVERLALARPTAAPTVVYYRDFRTYERALEALYQRLCAQGHAFVNGEVAAIESNEEGGLRVRVERLGVAPDAAADEAGPIDLDADLVVLATAQRPSRGSAELYRMFGVQTDAHGYPIENQPRVFRPTESSVERVFVLGAGCGPKVVQQASEQGSTAAMRALPTLLGGMSRPARHASRIEPERCSRCRSCEALCPHGAIRLTEAGALSDPAFCQGCGLCAAACPVHAAELTGFTDRQLLAQAAVAFRELGAGEPRILALLCYWCSYSAADFAGIARREAPANYRAIRVRCSSSVNTAVLMRMFQLGVDGILVAGCPERSCHHLWGNFVADKRVELGRAVMSGLGLDPGRLRFEYIGAPMKDKLLDTLVTMDAALRKLGPNPAARG